MSADNSGLWKEQQAHCTLSGQEVALVGTAGALHGFYYVETECAFLYGFLYRQGQAEAGSSRQQQLVDVIFTARHFQTSSNRHSATF